MGRLENFIPLSTKFSFQDSGDHTYVTVAGQLPLELPTRYIPFIRQINGHTSLREILIFLDSKGERISIREALATIHQLATQGMLRNGEDFLKIFEATSNHEMPAPALAGPRVSHSYFSKARLVSLIQKTTLFMSCERGAAEKILKHSKIETFQAKDQLIQQGSRDPHFFVLLSGQVEVMRLGRNLATLTPLSVFGESAAILDQTRNADVIASSEAWVLKINATKLMDTSSEEDMKAMGSLKSRLILNQTLSANPLFAPVPTDVLQLFLSRCQMEKHPKERMIVKQGAPSKDFYFILRGSVTIVKGGIPVTSLSEGQHFGEVSAIFQRPRTASVISESQCLLLSLSGENFYKVLCSHFHLAMDIEKTAKIRYRSKENVLTRLEQEPELSIEPPASLSEEAHEKVSNVSDEDFLEYTGTSYDMPVLDFTDEGMADEEAS